MIGWLRGRVRELSPEVLILDVSGVGYEVHIPVSTYYELEGEGPGAEVTLHVHTHVRDDTLDLYGFGTPGERRLFERLIAVSGIGPKLGRVILSGMEVRDLLEALAQEDAQRLATIPGVGKKTAERLILELKDKVAGLAEEAAVTPPSRKKTGDDDVVAALVNLGYKKKASSRAVAEVRREHAEAPFAEILRRSLKRLAGL
ncbi:MAG: Holliday junction branch migration protein RuvA [Thermoanaerobaculia bacterium]|nr:Holliday junction branch migration protein RuvA [Thermoanaerobaculia bacterium]